MKDNKIILFSNIKGGVGKSTLCILFAHYLTAKGYPVAVVDADIQRTIVRQRKRDVERNPEEKHSWEAVSVFDFDPDGKVDRIMPVLKKQEGWILVDCPGNMEADRLIPLFTSADVVVIPTTYEEPDLDATLSLFVPVLRKLNADAKLVFVPNRINEKLQKNMEDIKAARRKAMEQIKKFGHLTARIKDCVVFEPHRFDTLRKLDRFQEKAVEFSFDDIIASV